MQWVFLVGGRGTRLGSLTDTVPKPLLPVAGRPFLDILVERAGSFGANEVLLLAGYRGDQFVDRYDAWKSPAVRWVIEDSPLGTGGAIRAAAGELDERFILGNGDTFFDIDPRPLLPAQGDDESVARLALREVADASRYGTVELSGTRIRAFHDRGRTGEGLINAGLYGMSRSVIDWIPPGESSLERDVLPRVAADGRLFGQAFDGVFIDIGVPDDYRRAQQLLVSVGDENSGRGSIRGGQGQIGRP